jgi:hypothetical protein
MEHYDPLAAPDPKLWLALDEQERLDLAQDYHARAGISLPNARLHAVVHVIVENQVALGDEVPVERTLHRLMAEGLDRHEAVHAIGSALTDILYDASNDAASVEDPNSTYLATVESLTAEEWLGSADDSANGDPEATWILDELTLGGPLPVEALRAADAGRAALMPRFLQTIEQYVAGEVDPSLADAIFFLFHLFGQWREKSAYRPLAKLLRLPADETDAIFGGATTETTHRVMAAVFDGDPKPLYDVILDPGADEFIRSRMCEALAMVTLRGELPRAEAERFLRACYSDIEPQDECFVWNGWQSAIAMLGLVELKPLVEGAFRRGSVSEGWLSFRDFETDLRCAIEGSTPLGRAKGEYTLFGDAIEELSNWYCFSPEYLASNERHADDREAQSLLHVPAVNPFRRVGRNDPCPCGSGKKFKKCCLTEARSTGRTIELHQSP